MKMVEREGHQRDLDHRPVSSRPTTPRISRTGQKSSRGASQRPRLPMMEGDNRGHAAKLIWKLAPASASGRNSSTAKAPTATRPRLIAYTAGAIPPSTSSAAMHA